MRRFGEVEYRAVSLAGLMGMVSAGCAPDLGSPASLIGGGRILAVRGEPAEASPGVEVSYSVLAVTEFGTLKAPTVLWALCLKPKPLDENNVVTGACLGDDVMAVGDPLAAVTATVPMNACSLFGPETPPAEKDQPPLRPRDPDVSGGFYQPVRANLYQGGQPGSGAADVIAFGLERVTCNLPGAPIEIAQAFAKAYTPNRNPALTGVTAVLLDGGGNAMGTPQPLAGEDAVPGTNGTFAGVASGKKVRLSATWDEASLERYPVFDVTTRALVFHRESLNVSWFAVGGAFEHDRAGRTVACHAKAATDPGYDASLPCDAVVAATDLSVDNVWTAPATPGNVQLWAVLRDARGGVEYARYVIPVTQ